MRGKSKGWASDSKPVPLVQPNPASARCALWVPRCTVVSSKAAHVEPIATGYGALDSCIVHQSVWQCTVMRPFACVPRVSCHVQEFPKECRREFVLPRAVDQPELAEPSCTSTCIQCVSGAYPGCCEGPCSQEFLAGPYPPVLDVALCTGF